MARWPLTLERFLPYRLSVITNRISGALSRHYAARFGISIPEWRVIANLGRYPGLSGNQVAERPAMGKVTVRRAGAGLERKGRLERVRAGGDKRRSRRNLSARGIGAYAAVPPPDLGFAHALLPARHPAERPPPAHT